LWKARDRNGVVQNIFHSGQNLSLGSLSSLVGDTQLQFKGGTKAANDVYVGQPREITIDSETLNIRIHDGVTPGGRVAQGTALEFGIINTTANYTLGLTDVRKTIIVNNAANRVVNIPPHS